MRDTGTKTSGRWHCFLDLNKASFTAAPDISSLSGGKHHLCWYTVSERNMRWGKSARSLGLPTLAPAFKCSDYTHWVLALYTKVLSLREQQWKLQQRPPRKPSAAHSKPLTKGSSNAFPSQEEQQYRLNETFPFARQGQSK